MRLVTGDKWRLAQLPSVQAALVALAPDSGAVRALVGGFDFYNSKFNRVVQARRQPGSGFKPFIYSSALEAGYTAASMINDAPVVFDDPGLEAAWRPENYSGKFFGPTRLRIALAKSRNLVSIRLLRAVGIRYATDYLVQLGFDRSRLPQNLSLVLGTATLTPLEMAGAYSVFSNGGYRVEPYFIERIEDRDHEVIFQAQPARVCRFCLQATDELSPEPSLSPYQAGPPPPRLAARVMKADNHYIMYSILRDVVRIGTAKRARSLGRNDLAGKTGTTNDQRDAWFFGFIPGHIAVAWVGADDNHPLGNQETGGRAALPIWKKYMQTALDGVPEQSFPQPADLVSVRIDPETGLRARAGTKAAVFEMFRADHVPAEATAISVDQTGLEGVDEGDSLF